MTEVPPGALTEFAIAVATVGEDAVLADESVLDALDLAPVNARTIKVATPSRRRRRLPATVEVSRRVINLDDVADVEGIPALRVGAAIRASRSRVMGSRLIEAAQVATARRLIDADEAEELVAELQKGAS
jgi:hypothetical protein